MINFSKTDMTKIINKLMKIKYQFTFCARFDAMAKYVLWFNLIRQLEKEKIMDTMYYLTISLIWKLMSRLSK